MARARHTAPRASPAGPGRLAASGRLALKDFFSRQRVASKPPLYPGPRFPYHLGGGGGATVRKRSASLAASGVDRWALQVCSALHAEATALHAKSALCIFGSVGSASARPRLVEHTAHLSFRRPALTWGLPLATCVSSSVCTPAAFIPIVPAQCGHSSQLNLLKFDLPLHVS